MGFFNGLIAWTTQTFLPLGISGLFILAFIESSFFPIPPDILLIILTLADPSKALIFATVATIGSVLGGMLGYYIGYLGEKFLLVRLISKNNIAKAHRMFEKYGVLAVFIAGFTPVPYKIITISAGLLYLDFKKFVIASLISRALRFFTIAILLMFFGEVIVTFIDNHFVLITIVSVVVIILGFFIYKKYFSS